MVVGCWLLLVGWLVVFFWGGGDLDIHIDVIGDQGSSVLVMMMLMMMMMTLNMRISI